MAAACLLLYPLTDWGDPLPASSSWNLETLPQGIRSNNLDIKAATWIIESAKARSRQAGKPDNPRLTSSSGRNTNNPEYLMGFSFQQAFPITARLRLEKKVALLNIQRAEMEVRWITHQKVSQALHTAIEWMALRDQLNLLEAQIELASSLDQYMQQQVDKAERSPLEASLSRIQMEELRWEATALPPEMHRLENQLRSLLGLPADQDFSMEGNLNAMMIPAASEFDIQNHPASGMLQYDIQTHWATIDLERSRKWADWSIALSHQWSVEEDQPIGLERNRMLGLQLSIPLPWWQKNQGAVAASQANLEHSQASLEALNLEMQNEADSAFESLIQARARFLTLKDEIIPMREAHQQSLERAHRQGQATLEALLRAMKETLDMKTDLLEVMKGFHLHQTHYLALTQDLSLSDD